MGIHDRFRKKVELAQVYAEDGAFRTSARILRELAEEMDRHIAACDAAMLAMVGNAGVGATPDLGDDDPVNLLGSGPAPIERREG